MYAIVRREAFSDTTFLWEVEAPDVAKSAAPGHFVMLRLHEGGERAVGWNCPAVSYRIADCG